MQSSRQLFYCRVFSCVFQNWDMGNNVPNHETTFY
jgi:hypothetical protein